MLPSLRMISNVPKFLIQKREKFFIPLMDISKLCTHQNGSANDKDKSLLHCSHDKIEKLYYIAIATY